ncbi:MAG: response regulator transcription factor [Planctomycetes bacterium]|nr:response regulator transcription factor [Planctomycetota bacterium]
MGTIRVLLADDHEIVCDGLESALSDRDDVDVVGQARCGEDALKLCEELRPDVLVLDYSMPDLDGATVTRRLREAGNGTRVVFFTYHEGVHYALDALRAGAQGYVMKSAPTDTLVEALRTVAAGGRYVSPPLDAQVQTILERDASRKRKVSLSARETQVLRLLGEGLTLQEVARSLGVGESTASTYRARLMNKLQLENSAQIIRFALDGGFVSPGSRRDDEGSPPGDGPAPGGDHDHHPGLEMGMPGA